MKRIVVVLPNNLGDVIMALPMLAALKRHGECFITFLVEEGYGGGLVGSTLCDRIVTIQRKSIKKQLTDGAWRAGLAALDAVAVSARGEGCDTVINLAQHTYCSYLASCLSAPEIRGRHFLAEGNHAVDDVWSRYLYAVPYSRMSNELHASDVYCRIAGVRYHQTDKNLIAIDEEERCLSNTFLEEHGVTASERIILLQPGAAWDSKKWPRSYFVELGKKLTGAGYRCVITGAPSELDLAEEIASGIGSGSFTTAGKLSFRETIALCDHAETVVTGDTALMHAAAALQKKVVALFGPTSPVETGPYGTGHTVFCGTCTKRPCFLPVCNDMTCMSSILPDAVYRCITGGKAIVTSAAILTTSLTDGYYRVVQADGRNEGYVACRESYLTRKACGEVMSEGPYEDALREVKEVTVRFIQLCIQMEQALAGYRINNDGAFLSHFKKLQSTASVSTGLGAFWNALLNTGINSVPLIDPIAAVDKTINVIRETRVALMKALAE